MDTKKFRRMMEKSPEVAFEAVKNGAHDILNTWQAEARNEAPIDRGTLRKEIRQKLEIGPKLDAEMKLVSNTYRKGFNYAYYLHEVKGDQYLDRAAEKNMKLFQQALENEFKRSFKKAGW